MAYKNKQQDHEKRKNQEGSYSVYNYMYRYLMDNYEPRQVKNMASIALESLERKLVTVGKEYSLKGGNRIDNDELVASARNAIVNFSDNDDKHGDTAGNLGKAQSNSLNTIKSALSDLRW